MNKYCWSILLVSMLKTTSSSASIEKKPNVVLILIDDLSHYGVSAFGATCSGCSLGDYSNQPASTPRIDKLAETEMMCNNAFAYPLSNNEPVPYSKTGINSKIEIFVK